MVSEPVQSLTENIPNSVLMIPIVSKLSVRKQLPRANEVTELMHRWLWVALRTSTTVQVTPEYTARIKI